VCSEAGKRPDHFEDLDWEEEVAWQSAPGFGCSTARQHQRQQVSGSSVVAIVICQPGHGAEGHCLYVETQCFAGLITGGPGGADVAAGGAVSCSCQMLLLMLVPGPLVGWILGEICTESWP